jgi:hypothetical protein
MHDSSTAAAQHQRHQAYTGYAVSIHGVAPKHEGQSGCVTDPTLRLTDIHTHTHIQLSTLQHLCHLHSGAVCCLFTAVGGNHEASNYLRELFYGGWAAPNIYFMGFAGESLASSTVVNQSTDEETNCKGSCSCSCGTNKEAGNTQVPFYGFCE